MMKRMQSSKCTKGKILALMMCLALTVGAAMLMASCSGNAGSSGGSSSAAPSESSAAAEEEVTDTATLAKPTESRRLAEDSESMATLLYVNARLATDQLQAAMEAGAPAEQVDALLAEALNAWELADAAVDGAMTLSSALEQVEDYASYKGAQAAEAATKAQKALFPWVETAYADDRFKMEKFAREVEFIYNEAKPGHQLRAIAEHYGVDVKYAHAMLRQIEAWRRDFETKKEIQEYTESINVLKLYKAESEFLLLAAGSVVCPPAGVMGYATAGVSAVTVAVDLAEAHDSLILGEDHPLTRAVQKEQERLAPIAAITGLVSLSNLRPDHLSKLSDSVIKGATIIDGLWNGINLTNDMVQEGKILGFTVNFGGGSNGETTVKGTEIDMTKKGTPDQKEVEEMAKEAKLLLDMSADPNDPATQPHEPTNADVEKYRKEVKPEVTTDQVKEAVQKMEAEMPKAISNDTDGVISTEEAIAILDKLEAELEAKKQAEIQAANEELKKMFDEYAAELEKDKAEKEAQNSKGGYQISNIPNDMSDLATTEIAGKYHVTGTFKSPVFGEIPVDDTVIITEQGGQAVEIKGTGHGGINETGTMDAGDLTGMWPYECYGYWGNINTKYGKVEITRQGTDTEKDAIIFTGTLNKPEDQVSYELKGTKM